MGFLSSQLCTVHRKHSSWSRWKHLCHMQSIHYQLNTCFSFISLPNKTRCFVINHGTSHTVCKAYSKNKNTLVLTANSIEVHYVSFCALFCSSLSWTWSWLKSLVGIIYYEYSSSVLNRALLNQASTPFCQTRTASFLFDDQRSLTNVYELLLDFLMLFFRYEDTTLFQLLSALFFSLSHFVLKNKKVLHSYTYLDEYFLSYQLHQNHLIH